MARKSNTTPLSPIDAEIAQLIRRLTELRAQRRGPRTRQLHRLTARQVAMFTEPGIYGDGGCLFCRVGASGSIRWFMRYSVAGERRDLSFGQYPAVSLADARRLAAEAGLALAQGRDPRAERDAAIAAAKAERARAAKKMPTFRECAMRFVADHEANWTPKTARQWPQALERHVFPQIGHLPVDQIDAEAVVNIVRPLWTSQPVMGKRMLSRIAVLLDWSIARGHREGPNPATWEGRVEHLLPAAKVETKHHPALPYAEVAKFMAELRQRPEEAARGLELLILTATRSDEIRRAKWSEFDFAERVWTIPGDRTKTRKEHRIPLTDAAMVVLDRIEKTPGEYLFGYHANSMLFLVGELRPGVTTHGFRSTFRTWAAEKTEFQREVCEMALAHTVGSAVERTYNQSDLFEKRRRLMDQWADYCDGGSPAGGVVVPMKVAA